jgi:7-cyano-7-deazaguanine synthase
MQKFGKDNVLSLSFDYSQRHGNPELKQAAKICKDWNVDHTVISISCLKEITTDALTHHEIPINHNPNQPPNTLVVGRNGLMVRLGAIHINQLGGKYVYTGVIAVDGSFAGYRDCSRHYMDLEQEVLRLDLNDPEFEIVTPLVNCSKRETMEIAQKLGILEYLLDETVTCYEGIRRKGCMICPACVIRNDGINQFIKQHPEVKLPY